VVDGERRNQVRLPSYARVDARFQRSFFSAHHALTVFGEALNVLNRENQELNEGIVLPGSASGFSRPLVPRKLSAGIEVSLRR
jgi:hypothetical protein